MLSDIFDKNSLYTADFFFFSKLQHVLMQAFKKRIFKCRCLREKNESSESEKELQG